MENIHLLVTKIFQKAKTLLKYGRHIADSQTMHIAGIIVATSMPQLFFRYIHLHTKTFARDFCLSGEELLPIATTMTANSPPVAFQTV